MKKIAKAITAGILISIIIITTGCSGISDTEFDKKEKQTVELELENSESEEFELEEDADEEDDEIPVNARAIGGSKMRGGHSCSARHKSRRRGR